MPSPFDTHEAFRAAARRVEREDRQRHLRRAHADLDRTDQRIARALDLSAKHFREYLRDRFPRLAPSAGSDLRKLRPGYLDPSR